MTTLRDRQNMEILSVWKNINRQVVGRENKQIAVFPQSILPKQQRDLDVEVGTDKTIEQLSKVFEQKLAALEFYAQNAFLPRFKQEEKEPFSQAFQAVTSTGDVIPLWNQVVRYFQTPGLNNISNDMVKAKVQELKASLNALQYGLKGVINESFMSERMGELLTKGNTEGAKVLELLRSLSVYTLISRQVDSGDLLLITGDELKSAYKNILQTLSTNQIQILKAVSAENIGFTNAPLRGIPAFEAPSGRIKALQEELGVAFPPDMIRKLRNLPVGQLTERVSKINRGSSEVKEYQELSRLIEERENIGKELRDINDRIRVIHDEYKKLDDTMDVVSTANRNLGDPPRKPEGNQPYQSVISLLGATTESNKIAQKKANAKAKKDYDKKMKKWTIEKELNDRLDAEAKAINKGRDDRMKELSVEYNDLDRVKDGLVQLLDTVNYKILQSSDSISDQVQSLLNTIKPIGINENAEQKILETPVEGFGKRMETRGLASMRENYGKESDSDESESESEYESDEDALHFDDRRNDNYYSRPLKV